MLCFCVRISKLIPVIALFIPGITPAQSVAYLTPAISAGVVYDDNVFYSPDQKDGDFIGRISPELVGGYESQKMRLNGLYTFDAEYYADNTQLNSAIIRENALADMEYDLSRMLTLGLDGSYAATQSPGELQLLTLDARRDDAYRYSVGPSLDYQLGSLTHVGLGYTFAHEKASGGVEADIHTARTGFDRQINQKNTASLYYTYNKYDFTTGIETDSHIAMLGWVHTLSPRTTFSLAAGPRYTDSTTTPEIAISVAHEYGRGELSAAYDRTEATIIGESGTIDINSIGGGISYAFRPDLEFFARPVFSMLEQADRKVEVYQLGLELVYRLNESFSFSGSYDFSLQDGSLDDEIVGDIQRNVVFLSVKYTMPTFGDRPRGGQTR